MLNDLPKTVVYELKRLYGSPADVYHIVSITDDVLTGKSVTVKEKYHLKRVICLPVKTMREMFVTGAYKKDHNFPSQDFNLDDRLIIIDRRDLPANFVFSEKDYVITHYKKRNRGGLSAPGKRFNISNISEFDDERMVVVIGKFMKGGQLSEIFDLNVKEKIELVEDVDNNFDLMFADLPIEYPISEMP